VPFSGAGVRDNQYGLIAAISIGSFATLYVISVMWAKVFWQDRPAAQGETVLIDNSQPLSTFRKSLLVAPIVFLAAITLYIGLGAENIMAVAKHIAGEMKDTTPYIEAVLGTDQSQ